MSACGHLPRRASVPVGAIVGGQIAHWGKIAMAAPTTILWERDEHTTAKHRILRKYLDAWLPIMARYNPKLLLIDGFAGPGTCTGGEDGSPKIVLKAFLEHDQRARIETRELVYFFIESREGRAEHLSGEVDGMRPFPTNVSAFPMHGEYSEVMEQVLADVSQLVPTFAFIDPFGYKDTKFVLTSRILGFPRCEVIVYFPSPRALGRPRGHRRCVYDAVRGSGVGGSDSAEGCGATTDASRPIPRRSCTFNHLRPLIRDRHRREHGLPPLLWHGTRSAW